MAVVACFGCSWTHGATYEVGTNWVNELAKLYPQHEFFNLSMAGSSVLHSITVMEQFKKHYNPDVTIFQITNEGRVTYYLDDTIKKAALLFDQKNLRLNDPLPNVHTLCLMPEQVQSINYGTLHPENAGIDSHYKQRFDLAEKYYSVMDRDKNFLLEQKIYSLYIKDNVDLAFYHTSYSIPNDVDLPCIETILGQEQFNNYSSDGQGHHFTEEGCRWQAEYIKSLLINKL